MDSYVNIRIRPMPDLSPVSLMEAAFAGLHASLTILRCSDIGISFPEFDAKRPWLGHCLRLHGAANALAAIMETPWRTGMRDYMVVSGIQPVPATSQYRCVSRVQAKSNPERLRRRHMRRHGLTREEARNHIPDNAVETLNLPYIKVYSQSTGQNFRLFIRHGPLQSAPTSGAFNYYGLSDKATIPWF